MNGMLWQDLTQFSSIARAVVFFEGDAIVEHFSDGVPEHITAFKVRGKEGAFILAQRADGEGPVRWMPTEGKATAREIRRHRKRKPLPVQDPNAPRTEPNLLVGAWYSCEHKDQLDIVDYWARNARPGEYEVESFVWLKAFHIDGDVYEYAQRRGDGSIVARVLHKPSYRR